MTLLISLKALSLQLNNGWNLAQHQKTRSIGQAIIVAYKEDTQQLEASLQQEGFTCEVQRQNHQAEYQNFSPSYLCLLNHQDAWLKVLQNNKPALIVEADFVPVVGFGSLLLPFDPDLENAGICWLYTCASQVYSISPEGYAEGFSVSMVAYVMTPRAAHYLVHLPEEVKEAVGPNNYSTWDSSLDTYLRSHNLKNYICFRNYGEHGGLPNLEHHKNGLSKTHRADVLYGKLAFSPPYVRGQKNASLQLLLVRLKARLKGILRLLSGKFLRFSVLRRSRVPGKLLSFAILRQLSAHL